MSAEKRQPRARDPSIGFRIALVSVALLAILYSLIIMTRPLLGVGFAFLLFVLYFLWRFFHLAARFVRAVEQIADSLEKSNREGE